MQYIFCLYISQSHEQISTPWGKENNLLSVQWIKDHKRIVKTMKGLLARKMLVTYTEQLQRFIYNRKLACISAI